MTGSGLAFRYQVAEPWHPVHCLVDAFQAVIRVPFTSFVPFMCVAALALVEVYPAWQLPHVFPWKECCPVEGGTPWQVLHDCVGGVHVCVRTGVPAQPAGVDDATVRVCVPLEEQVLHAEYVYVQVGGT